MLIFPAIDLKNGKVVRLYKGDFDTVHQVADDPIATAKAFLAAGARHIHMVDLDGAKDGVRQNSDLVRAVAETGLRLELGGGIRSWRRYSPWGSGGRSSAPPPSATRILSARPSAATALSASLWVSTPRTA